MNRTKQLRNKKVVLVGACMLLGIPLSVTVAEPLRAQMGPKPAVCPPTSQVAPAPVTGQVPPVTPSKTAPPPAPFTQERVSPAVTQPPLPSQRQDPIATVIPRGREVAVQLVNRTGTTVNYEAIAATDYLPLKAGETKTLSGLSLPTTIALDRGDGGFLRLSTQSQPGLLKVYLYPSNNFNDDEGVLRIQPGGAVYLN